MQKLALVAALTCSVGVAQAKRAAPPRDPHVAWVEDEPMSAAAADARARRDVHAADTRDDGGTLREPTGMRAPELARPADSGARVDERVPQLDARSNADGDALPDALVERQMRPNLAAIDSCVAAAVHRRPSAAGTVELAVIVAEKRVAAIHVARDEVHDIDLDECLVKTGRTWRFQLRAARFSWPVTLSPSAAR